MLPDLSQTVFANATLGSAVVGGCLIGLAASWLFLSIGRIAGISGIAARALRERGQSMGWPLMFVLGLGLGGWLATLIAGGNTFENSVTATNSLQAVSQQIGSEHWPWLIAGGLLVGYGTRLGSGCTSGHGVCGIARLSRRSIVATCTFVGTGIAVATLIDGLGF